jgi:hypothetical protein
MKSSIMIMTNSKEDLIKRLDLIPEACMHPVGQQCCQAVHGRCTICKIYGLR